MSCPYRHRRASLLALAFILAFFTFAGETNALFKEGAGLQPSVGVTTNIEHAFIRKLEHATPQDTNDNASDFVLVTVNTPCVGTATSRSLQGLTLDTPPSQTSGGGLNSSLSIGTITLKQPLQPGQSIDVNFWLAVVTSGEFRYFLNIEAQP